MGDIKDNVLEILKDDEKYYGAFGKNYLSNSDIITLLNDPRNFRKDKEFTKPMLVGRYFHTVMLEPEKKDSNEFLSVDVASRNSKKYKEELAESGRELLMLDKEKVEIDKAISVMKSNLEFCDDIYAEGNEFEVPAVHEVMGMMWKGKADIVCEDMLIDIKTTGNIKDFKWSAKKYNYDSQAYLYQLFFNKPLVFYVIDKSTFELGIFHPSESFLMGGKDKVEMAIDVYNKFFGENATENIDSYITREIL